MIEKLDAEKQDENANDEKGQSKQKSESNKLGSIFNSPTKSQRPKTASRSPAKPF